MTRYWLPTLVAFSTLFFLGVMGYVIYDRARTANEICSEVQELRSDFKDVLELGRDSSLSNPNQRAGAYGALFWDKALQIIGTTDCD